VENAKKHRIGETEKQKAEEQSGQSVAHVEEKMQWLEEKWKEMQKGKFSVHPVGQERRCHGGIVVEKWNELCLGPRRGGLESLI